MTQPAKVCSAGGELLNWHLLKEGARGQRSGIRERENASSASRSEASGFIRGKKEKFVQKMPWGEVQDVNIQSPRIYLWRFP
jgi:hypothetical protein